MRVAEISDPASYHTAQWARQLMDREIEVHVVYVKGWYSWEKDRIKNLEGCHEEILTTPRSRGIASYLLRKGKLRELTRGMLNRTRLYGELEYLKPKLHDYMMSNSIDIIHAHYLHSGCFLAYASGFQPTVMSTWGSDLTDGPERYPYYIPLMRKALKSATIVQPMSEVSVDLVRKIYPVEDNRLFVTSWGADTQFFRPDLATKSIRVKLGIPPGIVILSFRALEPYYRIDMIIQAFKMISEKHKDVTLVIGNNGPLLQDLKRLCESLEISDRVVFTGTLSDTEMAQVFSMSDIYVQCPLSDGVTISGLQAIASGLPIIANEVGETRAIINHDVNGILLKETNDPSLYAEAFERLIVNDDLRAQMSAESRNLSETKHDRNKILSKFKELFLALSQGATDIGSIS
ncbi:MAG: glycosyltransferase family 4 protein [Candidatus Thorarchaeota archaeon]